MTDGTKDLSISALTAAGSATFNGNVTLGNASSDDITVTGSLASSIPIKTTNSYNIGSSTLGLAGIYLGNAGGSTTIRVISASSVSSSATYTIPDVGTTGNFVMTQGTQTISGAKTFDSELTAGNTSSNGATLNWDGASNTEYGLKIVSSATTVEGDGPNGGGFIYLDGTSDTSAAGDSGFDFLSCYSSSGEVFALRGDGLLQAPTGISFGNENLSTYNEVDDTTHTGSFTGGQTASVTFAPINYTQIGNIVCVSGTVTIGSSGTLGSVVQTGNSKVPIPVAGDAWMVGYAGILGTFVIRVNANGNLLVYSVDPTNVNTNSGLVNFSLNDVVDFNITYLV